MTIRLLHAEDDPDIREIALISLEMSGAFTIRQCEDGARALACAEAFGPDVLLLDVMMPGMTGPQLLARLRTIPALAETPAIFMTARAQESEKLELLESGAVAVIAKPFDPIALSDEICAAIGR